MVIHRMKEVVKCLEDFDLSSSPAAVANGQPIIIEEGYMAAA
jgi:hypothetical protein